MSFTKKGFKILKGAIPDDILQIVSNYFVIQVNTGALGDDGISNLASYGNALTEALLPFFQSLVEKHSGKKVYPTYSYVRLYQNGDVLKSHRDRDACEYGLTIPVAYKADALWPIYLMEGKKKVNVPLDIGDALLYKGCDLAHGRDAFTGELWLQIFLHYVDKKGKNAAWKFDKRLAIGEGRRKNEKEGLKRIK